LGEKKGDPGGPNSDLVREKITRGKTVFTQKRSRAKSKRRRTELTQKGGRGTEVRSKRKIKGKKTLGKRKKIR